MNEGVPNEPTMIAYTGNRMIMRAAAAASVQRHREALDFCRSVIWLLRRCGGANPG